MPVYEYQCQACGHQFEASQRITEPRLSDCPECKKPSLERLISATSFQLKGGGWYRDGYGDSKDKKPRTENDRADRLSKALDDDKKKTEAAKATSDSGGGGGSDGGGGGGDGGGSSGGGGGSSGGTASESKSAAA